MSEAETQRKADRIVAMLEAKATLAYEVYQRLRRYQYMTGWHPHGDTKDLARNILPSGEVLVVVRDPGSTGVFEAHWESVLEGSPPSILGPSSEGVCQNVDRWLSENKFLTVDVKRKNTPHTKVATWRKPHLPGQMILYASEGSVLANIKKRNQGFDWYIWRREGDQVFASDSGYAEHKDEDVALMNAMIKCENILVPKGWSIFRPWSQA